MAETSIAWTATPRPDGTLEEIEPITGDTIETVRYVSCDYCHETAVEDIWAGRAWRVFYRALDGSGLTICANCVERIGHD